MGGLCALCPDPQNTVLVCPGLQKGYLRVELYDIKRMSLIQAHEGSLGCFALSFDGKLLATASEKGTLIRIWDTSTGKQIQELRRGADHAEIQSLCFSPKTSSYLAVSSDKGTIHIFKIRRDANVGNKKDKNNKKEESKMNDNEQHNNNNHHHHQNNKKEKNPTSSLGLFKSVLPRYFSSEWSLAQFRVMEHFIKQPLIRRMAETVKRLKRNRFSKIIIRVIIPINRRKWLHCSKYLSIIKLTIKSSIIIILP